MLGESKLWKWTKLSMKKKLKGHCRQPELEICNEN
jgi:hypothetical protein